MPLDDLRKKIDSLDSELLRLLNERADVVHGIGEAKKQAGLMIYAPEREEALLQALARKNAALQGRLPEKSVRAIYREIMSASLALEKNMAIACLGIWLVAGAAAAFNCLSKQQNTRLLPNCRCTR